MNKVDQVINEIINAELSMDEYAELSQAVSNHIKEVLYAKFLLETTVSINAIRTANYF